MIRSVAIFCGSSVGSEQQFADAAREVTMQLCSKGITIIYGGGNTGLMGVVAQTALEQGANIVGIVPQYLMDKQVVHEHLQELIVVENIQKRKSEIIDRSDAFIVLPGGIGTVDEFFDAYTTMQLTGFRKPVAVLNILGYYNELLKLLHTMIRYRFLPGDHLRQLIVVDNVSGLMDRLFHYKPDEASDWIERLRKQNTY